MFNYLFITIFLVNCPFFTWAEPSISLTALQERAQTQHPEDKLFEHRLQAGQSMLSGEVYLPNPMLSYERMTSSAGAAMAETTWEFRQKLPLPWKTYLAREIYQKEIDSIQFELMQSQRVRKSQLTIEFFRWLSLHKKLLLKKEEEILLSQLIAVQRTRYISQKVTQVELVALQIERGNMLTEISMAEAELASQIAKVEGLVGPSSSNERLHRFTPNDEPLVMKKTIVLAESELLDRLDKKNGELRAMRAMVEKSQVTTTRAKNEWAPDLELMLTKTEDEMGGKKQGWQVGVELPLWLGGMQQAKISQAKAEALSAEVRYQERRRQMALQAEAMMAEQIQLHRQLELLENGLVQWSGQNVKSARIAYQTGKLDYASFLALIQSAYKTLVSYEELKVKVLENQELIGLMLGGDKE
jgi:outer membrane protein TolC